MIFVFALFILNVQVLTWTVAVPLLPFAGGFRVNVALFIKLQPPLSTTFLPPFSPLQTY